MGGGLFDMLVNQVISPNDQAMNAYFKNVQMSPQKVRGGNQMVVFPQQQQIGLGGFGGLGGVGLGQIGRINGMGGRWI